MNRDTAIAFFRSVCDLTEGADGFEITAGELTLHAGRAGAPWSVQHVIRLSVNETFVSGETRKSQRFAFLLEDLRGALCEHASTDKNTRKTGFM
ncbi:MAG: hypothetical protein Q8Q09_23150 [Deltaproteobacteria bacterium]|nr:hypothetical protein [Deltaproteobacteria bacterium]